MIQSEIGPRWIFSLKPSLKRVFPKHRTRRSCLGLSWICLGKGHAFLVSWISLLAVATSVRNLKFSMDVSWASLLCVSWACLGAVLDLSRAILGLSWTVLGQSWSCLGLSWAILGCVQAVLNLSRVIGLSAQERGCGGSAPAQTVTNF